MSEGQTRSYRSFAPKNAFKSWQLLPSTCIVGKNINTKIFCSGSRKVMPTTDGFQRRIDTGEQGEKILCDTFILWIVPMVLILDGSSKVGLHVYRKFANLTC